MKNMQLIQSFVRDEDGATAIEYALIAGIISIAIVGALTAVKGSLVGVFADVSNQFTAILN